MKSKALRTARKRRVKQKQNTTFKIKRKSSKTRKD